VRYYFDADVLGLAKVLAPLRPDITYPGDPGATIHRRVRPPCIVTDPAALDPDWVPAVTAQGWLIVTRDSRIAQHRAEVAAVRDNGARLVALSGREATSTWAQLEIVMSQWRRIEELLDQDGPFVYSLTRTSLRQVSLDA
jgi:hypothetical protein